MTSIGRRYTGGNVLSRAILITQPLSANRQPSLRPQGRSEGKQTKQRHENARPKATRHHRESPHGQSRRTRGRESERTNRNCSLLPPPSFLPNTAAGGKRRRSLRPWNHRQNIRLTDKRTKAAIARGFHLFPFRTEKLNPAAPMVLRKWESR